MGREANSADETAQKFGTVLARELEEIQASRDLRVNIQNFLDCRKPSNTPKAVQCQVSVRVELVETQTENPGHQAVHPLRLCSRQASTSSGRTAWWRTLNSPANTPTEQEDQKATLSLKEAIGKAHKAKLVGLAFSGGGIRSATFNLGVLQGLANCKLLPVFDYLSTVSGGGYIGSWFASWVRYEGLGEVAERLKTTHEAGRAGPPGLSSKSATSEEPRQIRFLRRYSNYLTPRKGWLTLDSLSFAAAWFRNVLLNLILLILVSAVALLLPRVYALLFYYLGGWLSPEMALALSFVLLGITITFVSLHPQSSTGQASRESGTQKHSGAGTSPTGQSGKAHQARLEGVRLNPESEVMVCVVLPFMMATVLISAWLWKSPVTQWNGAMAWQWGITGAGLYMLLWIIPMVLAHDKREVSRIARACLSAPVAGAVAGLLLLGLSALLCQKKEEEVLMTCGVWGMRGNLDAWVKWDTWDIAVWLPFAVAVIFGLGTILHIGLAGRRFTTGQYEWWNRLAAITLKWLCAVTLLAIIAMYSPKFRDWFEWQKWLASVLGWIGPTLIAVFAGKSEDATGWRSMRIVRLAVAFGPYIFALGLLVVIAIALSKFLPWFLPWIFGSAEYPDGTYWPSYDTGNNIGWWPLLCTLATLAAVAVMLSWSVGVNDFSMHAIYGTRLTRAYLGASNPYRKPHPFTDFDPNDNKVKLEHLRVRSSNDDPLLPNAEVDRYEGPYPLINATLNLDEGRELAWQQRKACAFVFTPHYCGYDIAMAGHSGESEASGWVNERNYRPTRHYAESVSLARAMTISGAAMSPSMGPHGSKPLAFLMTVFNMRLGWWLGNPGHEAIWKRRAEQGELWAGLWEWWHRHRPCWYRWEPSWKKRQPSLGMLYLLKELLGRTDAESAYVHLSDGGHFENLGIYELVRRRCRYIVACDAECDPELKFAALGNAIEKCRSDFGIEIEIDVEPICRSANGLSQRLCAIGRIRYSLVDGRSVPDGTLVYIKAALVKGVPEDIICYHTRHSAFPHEPTTDQWFDESQFESYRRLGQCAIETVFGAAKADAEKSSPGDCNDLFGRIAKLNLSPYI